MFFNHSRLFGCLAPGSYLENTPKVLQFIQILHWPQAQGYPGIS